MLSFVTFLDVRILMPIIEHFSCIHSVNEKKQPYCLPILSILFHKQVCGSIPTHFPRQIRAHVSCVIINHHTLETSQPTFCFCETLQISPSSTSCNHIWPTSECISYKHATWFKMHRKLPKINLEVGFPIFNSQPMLNLSPWCSSGGLVPQTWQWRWVTLSLCYKNHCCEVMWLLICNYIYIY